MNETPKDPIAAECRMRVGCASLMETLVDEARTDRLDPEFDFLKSRYWICQVVRHLYDCIAGRKARFEERCRQMEAIVELSDDAIRSLRKKIAELEFENSRLTETISKTGADELTVAPRLRSELSTCLKALTDLTAQSYETACSNNMHPTVVEQFERLLDQLRQLDFK